MLMLDMVIPDFWTNYTYAIIALICGNEQEWHYYSNLVFPKRAKCAFTAFGPSGSDQIHDALCLLPLNVINEKIFVFLWFWFITQLVASVLNFGYYTFISYSKNLRNSILRCHAIGAVSTQQVLAATNNGTFGDFFILKQIARNTNTATFIEILSELSYGKILES